MLCHGGCRLAGSEVLQKDSSRLGDLTTDSPAQGCPAQQYQNGSFASCRSRSLLRPGKASAPAMGLLKPPLACCWWRLEQPCAGCPRPARGFRMPPVPPNLPGPLIPPPAAQLRPPPPPKATLLACGHILHTSLLGTTALGPAVALQVCFLALPGHRPPRLELSELFSPVSSTGFRNDNR